MAPNPVKPNKLAIAALKPGAVKYEVSVVGYRGLVIRVWPSGEQTFVYRNRQDGQLRRIALKATSLAGAIAEWGAERQDAKGGVDVAGRRQAARHDTKLQRIENRRDPTVADLVARYITEYAKRHKRSWLADERLLTRFFVHDFGALKAKAVRRSDIHGMVHRIARKTPTQANRVLAATRKLYSFALDAGVIDAHPCLRMKAPAPENQRERVLSNAEIKILWNDAPGIVNTTVSDALHLQLLTACRITEVIGATASEFDLKTKTWTIPGSRTKNKLDHVVPLVPAAEAIVGPRIADGGYLFPWPTASGCLMADITSHQIIDAIPYLEMEHFTTHDLRRTVATRLAELGFSHETRERVLNHKDRSVMGKHYDKYDGVKEKRDALNAWARQLGEITSDVQSKKVIELRGKRK